MKVNNHLTNGELRSRLGTECMRTDRLSLFGHLKKKDENEWVKSVKHFEVKGRTNW